MGKEYSHGDKKNLTLNQYVNEKHFRKKAFAPYVNLTQEQVEKLAKNKKKNKEQ